MPFMDRAASIQHEECQQERGDTVLDRESLQRIAREQISAAAGRAAAFGQAVRPLWKADMRGRPTHVGSCVLGEIGMDSYVITAAHVADHQRKAALHIGLDELKPLGSVLETTVAPHGDRGLDVFDFAFMRFPDALAPHLGNALFVPETFTGVIEPADEQSYTCLGYPHSKSPAPLGSASSVRGALMSYTSKGRPVSQRGDRAQEGVHILVDRHQKFARDEVGDQIHAGGFEGFSGGAIFDLGALGTVANVLRPQLPRLAAILTDKIRKVVMGIRIDRIIEAIRSAERRTEQV